MSPAVSVRAAIPFGGKRAFNPVLDLPGLVWFIHPDDATDVIAGEINSVVDRKALATFTAQSGTRMARNTTERAPHIAAGSSGDYLRCDVAGVSSVLNGTPAHTWVWFTRQTDVSVQRFLFTVANGTSMISGADRITITIGATTGVFTMVTSGLATTNVSWTHGVDPLLWHTYALTYSGAGVVRVYIDGVLAASPASAIHRATTNLLRTYYGGGEGFMSVAGLCTGVLSTTDISNFHTWCTTGNA